MVQGKYNGVYLIMDSTLRIQILGLLVFLCTLGGSFAEVPPSRFLKDLTRVIFGSFLSVFPAIDLPSNLSVLFVRLRCKLLLRLDK
jgi:hypothetical protein